MSSVDFKGCTNVAMKQVQGMCPSTLWMCTIFYTGKMWMFPKELPSTVTTLLLWLPVG
jgi:hypothetical protein